MRRWLVAGWAAVAAALLLVAASGFDRDPGPGVDRPTPPKEAPLRAGDDRAAAIGAFLDVPAAARSIDAGVRMAEMLRGRYGIDTGDPAADRVEAARRAERELLDPLSISREDLARTARDLGYSLDPADCGVYCENVERLAVARLRQRALLRFMESAGAR